MKYDERIVRECLIARCYSDIRYEPDGNVPPDFLINGCVAVEARLLGQTFTDEQGVKGLQEVAIRLRDKVIKLLKSFGPPRDGESWLVQFRFSRPVEEWKALKPRLHKALEEFAAESPRVPRVLEVGNGFELSIIALCSSPFESMFVLGGYSDRQAGGWILNEMEKNLRFCIEEKSRKIQKCRHIYPEWWLVLVDRIGYGLGASEQLRFRELFSIQHDWDKIVLVSPIDPNQWFEI